jgi:predicted ATP-binding protein involved in virulence
LWRALGKSASDVRKPGSRFEGYDNCLNPASHIGGMLQWLKTEEMISLQDKQRSPLLEAVEQAIANCIQEIKSVSYHIREDDLIATFNNGDILPFRVLSDGIRNMLAMVADVAHRTAILNPQFGRRATLETPGVVLIDEIDLHLHPKWQRRIVEDLRRTFPKIQFIVTTHSPFVIQSLRAGELVDLSTPDLRPAAEYVNKSIDDIAENVMDIWQPQQSERYQKMFTVAQQYYKLLEEGQNVDEHHLEEIKRQLDELIAPFSDDVAYYAFLQLKRKAAGL